MVLTARKPKEKKIPVEELRENHLSGPGDETPQEALEALAAHKVVPVFSAPRFEKIIFRNQRDPGYPLEFHYSSATHPYKSYNLIDGKEYFLPTEVVRNLEGCRENVEKYRRDADGNPQIYIAGYKTHFVCERAA